MKIDLVEREAIKDAIGFMNLHFLGHGENKSLLDSINEVPTVEAVEVERYKALLEMYHELRENFIDYVCSGTCNVAPYCLNRCEGCVDRVGWCSQGSDECHGFNPAEIII